jgi:hypothetical protein
VGGLRVALPFAGAVWPLGIIPCLKVRVSGESAPVGPLDYLAFGTQLRDALLAWRPVGGEPVPWPWPSLVTGDPGISGAP